MAAILPATGTPVTVDPLTTLDGVAGAASEVMQTLGLATSDGAGAMKRISAQNGLPTNEAPTVTLQNAATVTANGFAVVTGLGEKELNLLVNVKASPTGTAPTLTYTVQDVDPIDGSTLIGQAITGAVINAIGTQVIVHNSRSGAVRVSWAIGGSATPSFTLVNSVLQPKTGAPAAPQQGLQTAPASNVASITLLAANSQRKGLAVWNDATTTMYVCTTGAAATTTNFTVKILPGQCWEPPLPGMTGLLTAIWDATPAGNARVTEYV